MHIPRLTPRSLLPLAVLAFCPTMQAQTHQGKDDIWREVSLDEMVYQKEKNYCMRVYGYYRYIDDGTAYALKRQDKLYAVYEGICELDVRYDRRDDEGAEIMAGRNLVHPDQAGNVMEFYELTPYTFLEKIRHMPKRFTTEEHGDTTRVYNRGALAGTAIRDTLSHELLIHYNALAPDTLKTINLIVLRAQLSNVWADATYHLDDSQQTYVPQGSLKHITFEGDADMQVYPGMGVSSTTENGTREMVRMVFHEHSELYIDSVVYLTKAEYRADRKTTADERRKRAGYTIADIDRLKEKLGVPPLSPEVWQRIEDQRDWEEMTEHWEKTNKVVRSMENTVGKAMEKMKENEQVRKTAEKIEQKVEREFEKQLESNDEQE